MYPKTFLDLFPAFPRSNRVFVAMPFASAFDARWEGVLEPAIRSVSDENTGLEPFRVDMRKISDSVLTDVLNGISEARLVVADVTTIGHLGGTAIRNGNVMYEVGIAHASRLPQEVLLFRSDTDPLAFDVANVRVNRYDPDSDPDGARTKVVEAIVDSLREIDLARHHAVRRVAEGTDWVAFTVLAGAATPNGLAHPELRTMRQVVGNMQQYHAIARLLDAGAIQTIYPRIRAADVQNTPDRVLNVVYRVTPFGQAIFRFVSLQLGGDNPELIQLAEQMFRDREREDQTGE